MATNTDAVDRLMVCYANCKLGVAAHDDLYAVLDAARDGVRRVTPGEDPKANVMAGIVAGWELHEQVARMVASGRRGAVLAEAREWLEDVAALTDDQYRLTVRAWAPRAKAARGDAAERSFKPRVRA